MCLVIGKLAKSEFGEHFVHSNHKSSYLCFSYNLSNKLNYCDTKRKTGISKILHLLIWPLEGAPQEG